MNDPVDLLAAPVLALLALAAGRALVGADGARTAAYRWAIQVAAGLVALHLLLLALDLSGNPWSRWTVLGPMALLAVVGVGRGAAVRSRGGCLAVPGWGEALALAGLAGLAVLLLRPALTMPDVVFHWGIKAERFFLAGGIDTGFLSRPWNFNKHADYPHLVPGLYASGALVRGRFSEATFLPWTLAYLGLVLVGAREAFGQLGQRLRFTAQATIAVALMTTIAFTVGHMLGGSPDLLLAGVLTAAIPAVLGAPTPARDRQLAVLAALGAGAKYEGVALAAFLIAARLWQRHRHRGRLGLGIVVRLAWPTVVVAGLWWLEVWRLDLAQGNRAGVPDLARVGPIVDGVVAAIRHPHWYGLAWVVALLPLLLMVRRVRPIVAAALAQAALYGWVYLTSPLAADALVATSADRLLVHLVPAAFVLGGLAWVGTQSPTSMNGRVGTIRDRPA